MCFKIESIKKHPEKSYNFSIEIPDSADSTFDYVWGNIHRNVLQANKGNTAWARPGGTFKRNLTQCPHVIQALDLQVTLSETTRRHNQHPKPRIS